MPGISSKVSAISPADAADAQTAEIARTAPAELRGTAFGMFNLITGIMLLLASVLAGALWDLSGPKGTFLAGAGFTLLTLAGLAAVRGRLKGA